MEVEPETYSMESFAYSDSSPTVQAAENFLLTEVLSTAKVNVNCESPYILVTFNLKVLLIKQQVVGTNICVPANYDTAKCCRTCCRSCKSRW